MAFRDRFNSVEEYDDWLLAFYEERIITLMDGIGEFTEYGTMISPTLIKTTMDRYIKLLEDKYVIDRKLS
jgi:hypothetical protein|tara:strand:- start:5975 stop:6184 length:210 start_codon:yes stop_codon:yes gene_type:complete